MNIVITDNANHNYIFSTTIALYTDTISKETTLNSTQVFNELPPITRMDTMVSAITSLPIVYSSPSNRKLNIYTEDTSPTIGISMTSGDYNYIIYILIILPTVYPTPSNRETNTEDTSPTTGISVMSRL